MNLIGEAVPQGRVEEQCLDVVGVSGRRLGGFEGNGVVRHGGELLVGLRFAGGGFMERVRSESSVPARCGTGRHRLGRCRDG